MGPRGCFGLLGSGSALAGDLAVLADGVGKHHKGTSKDLSRTVLGHGAEVRKFRVVACADTGNACPNGGRHPQHALLVAEQGDMAS